MMLRPEIMTILLAAGAAAFFCRAAGFFLMRFVPITPRLEAALRATPLAVMVGICAPVAARGNPAELAALVAVGIAMKLTGNDLIAAAVGVATVAMLRVLTI
jgi:uncharacterized membrane protein